MYEEIGTLMAHLPLWVWAVLAYGLWMGFQATRERTVSLVMTTVMPLVFWALSLSNLVGVAVEAPAVALVWLLAVACGGALGWYYLTGEPVAIDRPARALTIPGTWVTLGLFVVIFATKVVYGYWVALDPEGAQSAVVLVPVFALAGLSTGVVTGRTARLYAYVFDRG